MVIVEQTNMVIVEQTKELDRVVLTAGDTEEFVCLQSRAYWLMVMDFEEANDSLGLLPAGENLDKVTTQYQGTSKC